MIVVGIGIVIVIVSVVNSIILKMRYRCLFDR